MIEALSSSSAFLAGVLGRTLPLARLALTPGICPSLPSCGWLLIKALSSSSAFLVGAVLGRCPSARLIGSRAGNMPAPLMRFAAPAAGARCIVVLAANGKAARLIAKYRPNVPVVVGVVPRRRRDSVGFKVLQ